MIWLLVPLVAACMAYVCSYVWALPCTVRWDFGGPDIPPPLPPLTPTPLGPDDRAPTILDRDDLIALAHIEAWRRVLA